MRSFAELFKGRDDAYGTYGSIAHAQATDRGKRVGRAQTVRGAVTQALYDAHLAGEQRLGIAPVLKNSTCWWFCIDVDFYQEKGLHESIASRILELGLPLVMTRSKSGGAHLWCFFDAPISAGKARETAQAWAKKLKLPTEHVDIFPAQASADDIGNWVNIPYFGDACHCAGEDGEQNLSLEEFLEYANERVQHSTDLKKKTEEKVKSSASDAPPCIDYMIENGVPEGYRNNAVTQYAVYAKKAFPDAWKDKTREFNDEHCDPAMPGPEVTVVLKSVQAKEFQYLCKKIETMFCDKKECKLREFGIGGGPRKAEDIDIDIQRIEKIDGEEPIYRVTIKDKRFQINLDQLFLYNAFKKAALGATNEFLPVIKQPEWEIFMKDVLERMEIEEAAADTQMRDRIIRIFMRFAEGTTTESLDVAVDRALPYLEGKNLIFNGDDFMQIVDRAFTRLPREKTWAYMRDWGCVLVEREVGGHKKKFWMYVPDGPLWFEPDKGEQA